MSEDKAWETWTRERQQIIAAQAERIRVLEEALRNLTAETGGLPLTIGAERAREAARAALKEQP